MARPGFALAFTIILMLGLSMLAGAMLFVALGEDRIAATLLEQTTTRLDAESRARATLAHWSTDAVADLAHGEERIVLRDSLNHVAVMRLGESLYLIRSEVAADRGGVPVLARVGVLVRTAVPGELKPPAAVLVREEAVLRGGYLSGRDGCAAGTLPGLAADSITGHGTQVPEGIVPVPAPRPTDPLATLPLPRMATVTPGADAGTPRPTTAAGTCQPDEWNWGSSSPPCHEHLPLIHHPGDLTVHGGEGQGVLVVDGDLTLHGDFRFSGVIRVKGTLRVRGATLTGQFEAGRLVIEDGEVTLNSCAAERAMRAAVFDRAFRPTGRWWLPVH
ncbi:MAG TPA: polymer-forming cytoskeletal protein [Longimicrobiales bacterium]|nr:polymer-forming cytoskeletal protein [Longimicrobiales bacterium]